MAPERLLGDQPWRRAALIVISLAIIVLGLAAINVKLVISNGNQNARIEAQQARLDAADSLRALEARAKTARAASECRARIAGTKQANLLLAALRDLAVIPQKNLHDVLSGPLTAKERADRVEALARYEAAEKRIHRFPLPKCVESTP